MMLQQKFDYKPLSRVDHPSGRKYIVGEGRPLPSVTTILSATKDMTYLKEWRAAVGEAEATRIVTESSGLGSSMHNLLEDYILGREMKGQFMAVTLAKLIIKKGLCKVNEVWGTEVALYSTDLYAGTTDLVGLHENVPAIMDYKNSRQEKTREMIEDYRAQLAAYALAHNEMYGTNINKGVIMMATRAGKYQEFIFEGYEFTECINLWLVALDKYYILHRDDK
jgi:CRISPR/Cas system-associated exonuclease Cas4 (RecB family)